MRFSIMTLGCKVNQYDGEALAAALRAAGLRRARSGQTPDLVVVNTCCVTATAMRKSRQALRRLLRRWPGAAVLVTGCYSDYDGRRIGEILTRMNVPPDRAALAGHHGDLAARIEQFARRLCRPTPHAPAGQKAHPRADPCGYDVCISAPDDARIAASPDSIPTRRNAAVKAHVPAAEGLPPLDRFAGHQRAFVKVQDGCDAFCSYCIVPYTRPRVWSRSVDDVADECRRLVAAGHKEIVLCGVSLGSFGRATAVRRRWEAAPSSLPELLREIARIDGLWRVRLSSIEPGDVTDDLLAAVAELPAAARHFHLPLQSGSQRILRRMNRQYTADEYRRTVERIASVLDRPALTTDVIVGFPGEQEDDFAGTLAMAEFAGFAKIHAFPFSPVEPTAAWRHRDEAPPAGVVRSRMARLAETERRLAEAYRRRFLGETLEALVERPRASSPVRRAMTDRYLTVTFGAPRDAGVDLTGRVVRVGIDAVTAEGLAGHRAD